MPAAVSPGSNGGPAHKHGDLRAAKHFFGGRTEQSLLQPSPAVRSQDDQIDVPLLYKPRGNIPEAGGPFDDAVAGEPRELGLDALHFGARAFFLTVQKRGSHFGSQVGGARRQENVNCVDSRTIAPSDGRRERQRIAGRL